MIPTRPAPDTPPGGTSQSGDVAERLLLRDWGARLSSRPWQVLFLVLAVAFAGLLSYEAISDQITETGVLHEDRVSLASFMNGTAAQPFAYRIVTPLLMRIAQDVFHAPSILMALPGPLAAKLPQWCVLATSTPLPACDTVDSYFAVAGVYCFCFLMLVYAFGLRLFAGNPMISLLAMYFFFVPINAILLLHLSHMYDFGALMFATLLLLCLERGWNIAFTLIMPVAFLTKETLVRGRGDGGREERVTRDIRGAAADSAAEHGFAGAVDPGNHDPARTGAGSDSRFVNRTVSVHRFPARSGISCMPRRIE
jgi:hypothetical protein